MEIEKIWKIVFDPDKSYTAQVNKLKLIYQTTHDKDKPDAIEATAPGLGNCLNDYLRDQGLPVYPRVIDITDPNTMDEYLRSHQGQEAIKRVVAANVGEIRRILR